MTGPDTRQLPLFPLPNVVHFPDTELHLHIFEPRYRQLISDLQQQPEKDRLIGMVLLKPGWESSNEDPPEIYEPGTAGLMVQLDYLDDGRSNIVLRGQYRFQVRREFPSHPYRQALVWPLEEPPKRSSSADSEDLKRELAELLASLRQRIGRAFPIGMSPRASEDASLDELVNTIAAQLDVPAQSKLDLLARELPERAHRVLTILRSRDRVLDLLEPFSGSRGDPDLN